jgi:hypothetical protein
MTAMVSCPGCNADLRLPETTPADRLRCPRCKTVFDPILSAEPATESVAFALDEDVPPPRDPDQSFFERLAGLDESQKTTPPPAPPVVEPPKPAPRKRPRRDDTPPESGNRGVIIAVITVCVLVMLGGFAGASFLVYKLATRGNSKDDSLTQAGKPEPAAIPEASFAKVKAATVLVRTHFPDGQVTSSGGFFVPGPGLIVTNGRSVGQDKKPTPATKVNVILGDRAVSARILAADPELDLALLQVAALDLPEPLPLTLDTFTVKEPQPLVVFSASGESTARITTTNVTVAGSRQVAGTRGWFTLAGWLPHGAWGGPATDASGRVVGVANVIPGSDTSAIVPTETVNAFVQSGVKSAESKGAIPFASADAGKKRHDADDTPWPGMPNDPFGGRRPPLFPPGVDPFRPPMFPGFDPPPGFPQPRPRDRRE